MLADPNARRRNLMVISLIIIFYFASGAHFDPGEDITLGILKATINADRTWVIFASTWIMFFWFWWQFRINSKSIKIHFYKDLDDLKTSDADLVFLSSLHKVAFSALSRYDQKTPSEKGNAKQVTCLEINKSNTKPFALAMVTFRVQTRRDLGKYPNTESFTTNDLKSNASVLIAYVKHRPGFSDILAPQLLAASALTIAIACTYPILFIAPCIYILNVFLQQQES